MTAALLGLRFRRRHGRGVWADIGMYQMGCYNVSDFVLDNVANGAPGERIGNRHRQFAPQGTYRCAGRDEWVTLCVRDDDEWKALCALVGQPGLASDPRYATVKARHENHDAIDEIITRWTKTIGKMEAMERIQSVGVPAGAVLENRDLHFNPQIAARGLLEWIDFPPERKMGPRRRVIGRPWHFSRAPMQVRGPAPLFGQDNRQIMRDILGYDDAKIEALARLEAFADQPKKTRETPDVSMDDRVKLGRLAYWEPDYHKQLGM
jgi:benzylsuccinate CoA-transferase BbsF subunit